MNRRAFLRGSGAALLAAGCAHQAGPTGRPVASRQDPGAERVLPLLEVRMLDDRTLVRTLGWAGLERTLPFAASLTSVSVRGGRIVVHRAP